MRSFYLLAFILLFAIQTKSQSRSTLPASQETISLRLFPNPATTQITFNFENGYDKNFSFQIYNFIGKKVYELRSVSPRMVVDLSDYFRGVYIFQFRDKTGRVVESGRFTVER